jgi:hypothetical protein
MDFEDVMRAACGKCSVCMTDTYAKTVQLLGRNGQFYVPSYSSHGGAHQDKPKLCYDRRTVGRPSGQAVLVSSPSCYCQTVKGLHMWGALSGESTGRSVSYRPSAILGSESPGTRHHILFAPRRLWGGGGRFINQRLLFSGLVGDECLPSRSTSGSHHVGRWGVGPRTGLDIKKTGTRTPSPRMCNP